MPVEMTVADLLLLPTPIDLPHIPGGGTLVLLPDGESTMMVRSVTDDRWRSYRGTTIQVHVSIDGPAAEWTAEQMFAAIPGCQQRGPGRGPGGWTLGFHHQARLTVIKALPHTCAAEPGRPCADRPPYWRRCTAAARWLVDVTAPVSA